MTRDIYPGFNWNRLLKPFKKESLLTEDSYFTCLPISGGKVRERKVKKGIPKVKSDQERRYPKFHRAHTPFPAQLPPLLAPDPRALSRGHQDHSPRATHTTPHSPLSTKLLANVKPTPPPTPPRHILIPLPFPLCSPPPYSDQGNVNFLSFPHLSGARCHRRRRRRTFLRRNEWSRCARVVLRCWVCRRRTQTRGHISHPYRVDLLHV